VKSFAFLFWAYNVIWLVIAGYLLSMVIRMGRLDRRLDRVERELDRESAAGRRADHG
jgi:CcmD family protein